MVTESESRLGYSSRGLRQGAGDEGVLRPPPKGGEEGMVPFAVTKLCEKNRNWRKKWQEILSNPYVLYAGLD